MARALITVTIPDFRKLRVEGEHLKRSLRRVSVDATDIAAQKAQKHVQAKIKAVGLKRLSNAVGYTSAKRKRQTGTPYGVIYARGGDESLAGGALEAYGQGTTIRAHNGQWLAYATGAVPSRIGRKRMTPARYLKSGLPASIGKLIFRKIKPDLAILVLRKVSLSPKTGQAKALGKRAPRTRVLPKGDVVAFVLIKQTKRAKRFDKDQIVRLYSARVPQYMDALMRQIYR